MLVKKKIAIDTHHLLLEHAGTRRVTIGLMNQFRKMDEFDFLELSPSYSLNSANNSTLAKIGKHIKRLFWVHVNLPLLCIYKKVDVLLSPEFNTPLFVHCKRCVIVHDVHMRAQNKFTSTVWFYLYYIPFIEIAIRRADKIFTISNFAKEQIIHLMKLDPAKIRVIYHGLDEIFMSSQEHKNAFVKLNLLKKQYILFVGTFEARKNIERLIDAFYILKQKKKEKMKNIKLVVVGKGASGKHSDRSIQINTLIKKYDLENEIVLCGFVPDQMLPDYYRNALMLAFPSLHEGFGLPIIEGFASGVPVITSNLCSMPEIADGAALLVDPYNVEDIVNKLEILLFDAKLCKTLINAGYERIKNFNWENVAKQYAQEMLSLN
jgi:glycosyltransferase involved in cell wall biosynthesis